MQQESLTRWIAWLAGPADQGHSLPFTDAMRGRVRAVFWTLLVAVWLTLFVRLALSG